MTGTVGRAGTASGSLGGAPRIELDSCVSLLRRLPFQSRRHCARRLRAGHRPSRPWHGMPAALRLSQPPKTTLFGRGRRYPAQCGSAHSDRMGNISIARGTWERRPITGYPMTGIAPVDGNVLRVRFSGEGEFSDLSAAITKLSRKCWDIRHRWGSRGGLLRCWDVLRQCPGAGTILVAGGTLADCSGVWTFFVAENALVDCSAFWPSATGATH